MEHEVHVPFAVGAVRSALAEPERALRCVPGLTIDAPGGAEATDEATVRGRLRVRAGGLTITYRGTLRLITEQDGFAVEAEGVEARGEGRARLRLTVRPSVADVGSESEGPTALAFTATMSGEGRIEELEEKQLHAAGRRLLDRFATALSDSLAADPPADDNTPVIPGIPAPDSQPQDAGDTTDTGGPEESAPPTAVQDEESGLSVFETEMSPPPPSSDAAERRDPSEGWPRDEDADVAEEPGSASQAEPDPVVLPETTDPAVPAPAGPPAEAAHARRTMIGRSAEEVDHAPPRGRYAPEPPPQSSTSGAALRWAAPAAAVALASAVVISRVIRRRNR